MALTIRPTDGLVHRLLQQQTRTSQAEDHAVATKGKVADKVNISGQARQQNTEASDKPSTSASYGYKQQDLESQLLRLYTHNNTNDGDGSK